jgi:hypothetical protein
VIVSVRLYAPVRSASLAPMCRLNAIVEGPLETGPLHAPGVNEPNDAEPSVV